MISAAFPVAGTDGIRLCWNQAGLEKLDAHRAASDRLQPFGMIPSERFAQPAINLPSL
jgi:hypothetical protein